MIRVGISGYGVIGRRVADAVALQPDMELTGIAKVKPDYKARLALSKGYNVYAVDEKSLKSFEGAGLNASGTLNDLLKDVDIIVDASPEDVGAENKPTYERLGKKAIFQGGEAHEVAGFSFVAQCNFDQARDRRYVRVVSCNTTGLCRALNALDQAFGIEKARAVIARRATDPDDPGKGPIDAVALDPVHIPSHHGPDVNTVLPHINIVSMAIKVPTTHMHLHALIISIKDSDANEDKVIDAFKGTTRLLLLDSGEGFKSTAHVIDYARELRRSRSDLYEVAVWKDSIKVADKEVYFYMGVHQESIVVPEDIDAIRALSGGYSSKESIRITNEMLRIENK